MKNRLKVLRAERNISQQRLANALGVSRGTVNRIELGKCMPSGITLIELSKYFNVAPNEIFLT